MKNDIIYWMWLQNIRGISTSSKIKLLSNGVSPEEIYKSSGSCLADFNVPHKTIGNIASQATEQSMDDFVRILDRNEEMSIISYFDYNYPSLLYQIKDPPILLYYKGNIELLKNRCLAIIGTRSATERGKYHARSFAREIAAEGYTIVGGLSAGIEAAAHLGALSMGATCAVMHSGLDKVYPKENRELFEKICNYGVAISEHMPGKSVGKFGIPLRNRIVSGLCEAVLLVEAPEKSGALCTVDYAIQHNRDVYVLDYGADSPESSGNRALINDGAIAVTNPFDIINNPGYTAYDSVRKPLMMSAAEVEKPQPKVYDDISDEEMSVLELIRKGINQFDEIAQNSELDIGSLGYILTVLEFNGVITQKIGKVYEENS